MATTDPVGSWLGEVAEQEVARWCVANGWAVKHHSNLASPTDGPPVLRGPGKIDWLLPDLELIAATSHNRRAVEFWEVKYLRPDNECYVLRTSKLSEWQAVARFHGAVLRIAVVDSRTKELRTYEVPAIQDRGDVVMRFDMMANCGKLNADPFSLEKLARRVLTSRQASLHLLGLP